MWRNIVHFYLQQIILSTARGVDLMRGADLGRIKDVHSSFLFQDRLSSNDVLRR